jgi:hypothetical protein
LEKHYNLTFLRDYYAEDLPSMTDILKLYLQETPKNLMEIETCLMNNNAAGAKAATHKIKTNTIMLGMADPAGFIDAMHHHPSDAAVKEEAVMLFRIFKTEVVKALQDIESDFFAGQ